MERKCYLNKASIYIAIFRELHIVTSGYVRVPVLRIKLMLGPSLTLDSPFTCYGPVRRLGGMRDYRVRVLMVFFNCFLLEQ
jgi:hypothetical protein